MPNSKVNRVQDSIYDSMVSGSMNDLHFYRLYTENTTQRQNNSFQLGDIYRSRKIICEINKSVKTHACTLPNSSACCWRNCTNSSRILVFSVIHLDWYAFSNFRRVSGILHFFDTGKKCGYCIVTLHCPLSFLSKESIKSWDTPFSSSFSKYK